METKESSPATDAAVRDWEISDGDRPDHTEATSVGHDFAAFAGEREVKLFAEHGDCLSDVEPISQARWLAIAAVVRAEREAGVAFLRFAAGRIPWSVVKTAVRTVDDRHRDLADVAPDAITLCSQICIADDMAVLLESTRLPASTFYRSARRK